MKLKTLLVANRGEIAVRILRSAREMGITTYQVYSEADADSLAVKLADHAICIGGPSAEESYLNADLILEIAKKHNIQAIHPGYGFLSENPDFAEQVIANQIIFIGPSANTMRQMADKAEARQTAIKAGIAVIKGSLSTLIDAELALIEANNIGFPVMIKASAGGGGRGIRVVEKAEDFINNFDQASAEAKAAFGDGRLYLEQFIAAARHIEVQILADGKHAVHLFERECSVQRRRQKVWEEAPCSFIEEETRKQMCQAAVMLAEKVNYSGAGTIEFLYDQARAEFFFIEMNTRIQVEHPITEAITGVDIVAEMISISAGNPITFTQSEITYKGHAIEVRINAEDPFNNFMPSPGTITLFEPPQGIGVRFDGLIYNNYTIPPYYDSLLGKLIVWGRSRNQAINRLERALDEMRIEGVKTTQPLFKCLCAADEIHSGNFDTNWLEPWLSQLMTKEST